MWLNTYMSDFEPIPPARTARDEEVGRSDVDPEAIKRYLETQRRAAQQPTPAQEPAAQPVVPAEPPQDEQHVDEPANQRETRPNPATVAREVLRISQIPEDQRSPEEKDFLATHTTQENDQ